MESINVELSSSDLSEARVTSILEIPAGQVSASTVLNALDDDLLDGTQAVTVTASAHGFVSAEVSIEVTDHETLAVDITPASIVEASESATVTVTRGNQDVGQPLTVRLHNNDESELAVPATVTLPANQSSVSFEVTSVDDDLLDATQTVTITASASGYVDGRSSIQVTDQELLDIDIVADAIPEGGATTATVSRRNSNVAFPLVVTLVNSHPDKAVVSTTTTAVIRAGATTSLPFSITALSDNVIGDEVHVTLTVSAPGYLQATDSLVITNRETLSLTIQATSISELAGVAIATLRRNNVDIDQPVVVQLASSNADRATVPATVTIPPNQAAVNFAINAVDNLSLDGTTAVTISATAPGYDEATSTLEIADHETLRLSIDADAISERGGLTTATVTRTDGRGDLSVNLTSSDTSEAIVVANIFIPDGATTSGLIPINAVDDGLLDGTQTVTFTASAAGYVEDQSSLDVTDFEGWQNPTLRFDVNRDEMVTPNDILRIVNELNELLVSDPRTGLLPPRTSDTDPFLDPNGDGFVTPADARMIANFLNGQEAEGDVEGKAAPESEGSLMQLNVAQAPTIDSTARTAQGVLTSNSRSTSESLFYRPIRPPARLNIDSTTSRASTDTDGSRQDLDAALEDIIARIAEDVDSALRLKL